MTTTKISWDQLVGLVGACLPGVDCKKQILQYSFCPALHTNTNTNANTDIKKMINKNTNMADLGGRCNFKQANAKNPCWPTNDLSNTNRI